MLLLNKFMRKMDIFDTEFSIHKSIWTKVEHTSHELEHDNSEPSQQTVGGGEGALPVPPEVTTPVSQQEVFKDDVQILPTEEVSATTNIKTVDRVELNQNVISPVTEQANGNKEGDWQTRESELLKKIEELEKLKTEAGADGLKLELKVKEEEIDLLKARVKNLETELQAALSKPGAKNQELVDNIKRQHEELLSKAKGMIFDKTKMVKNQELQIEALTTQVQSLKDINAITKDLLEIRNAEVKSLEERLEAMDLRFKTEKERFSLLMKKTETSSHINDDLRKEYETQLAIFKELRQKYEERVQALVVENNKLKDSLQPTSA